MSNTKKNFIYGAAILGIAGLLSKVIGAFYRIPLTNIIDETGMGLYSLAYPIYATLLIISTAGLPTAISKMVAARIALGDRLGAYKIFKNAFNVLLIIGLITSAILFIFGTNIARALGDEKAGFAMMAIAPSLFFVSIISAYRGYFQGYQNMAPTALSQVVEQLFKLLVGFTLAVFLMKKFAGSDYRYAYAAAGAITGVTFSEFVALLFLNLIYRKRFLIKKYKVPFEFDSNILNRIAAIAIPVTIGASIMPLVDLLDAAIVINSLKEIPKLASQATSLYGILKGMVNPIVNMPAVLTVALAMSLVPAISESLANRDRLNVKIKAATGLKLALLIGLPSCAGLYLLAHPILSLLYHSRGAESLNTGATLLRTLSFAILFLSIVQTMTGVLQGLGKVFIPVRNLFIGAILKAVINFILVSNPEININGAPIGTIVCYATAAILNLIAVIRYAGIKLDTFNTIIKPLFSTALMAFVVTLCNIYLPESRLTTLFSIIAGFGVYFISLIMLGTFTETDLELMPGGRKLSKVINKFNRHGGQR